MQICLRCNVCQSPEEFGPAKSIDSVSFNANVVPAKKKYCKTCLSKEAREWRAAHKGYDGTGNFSKYSKEDRKIISAISTRINQSKQNNKRLNRPHNITVDYMFEIWQQQKGMCRYTKQKLFIEKESPAALSIDKIIPELGYVVGNVQWVAWAVNRAKGDLEEATFFNMCASVTKGATTIP